MNLAALAIKRPIFISCIFILTLAVGIISLLKLPVDLFPDITFPVVTITTPYPGAGPKEIETLVSKVIEDEVSSIAGLKTVSSNSKEGVSIVVAEFSLSTDVKYAEQQVRDKISSARRKLPSDIKESTIRRIDPSDQPILSVSIVGSDKPAETYDYASEIIKPQLQKIDQVGLVEILGGRKREIQVELNQDKLRLYEISAQQVSQRIGAAGQNIPAGRVNNPTGELTYRTLAEFQSPQEIASIIVNFFQNEKTLRVQDLGKISDTLEDEQSRVYFNDVKSLTMFIYKQSGSNTISVVEQVKKQIEKLNINNDAMKLPYRLNIIRDNSKPIKANVDDVKESIILGIILTFVVVLFFLGNLRSTLITSIALPNSLLGAFILMTISGFSINIMTLLALSLAVGLLIDDAIVVRENIFRHLEMGHSPFKAALDGTLEVTLAVVATTLTVIAVFGPIGFLSGVVGQFFKQFGLTVCFAMMISLFDALTMAPMLSAYFAGMHKDDSTPTKTSILDSIYNNTLGVLLRWFESLQNYLDRLYNKWLIRALDFPKITISIGVFIFLTSLVLMRFVTKTFLPPQDNGEFQVSIELKPGANLDQTEKQAFIVKDILKSHSEIDKVLLVVGTRDGENHKASFTVLLKSAKERKLNTSEVKQLVRDDLKKYPEITPIVSDIDAVGGGQRPFNLVITGNDLDTLEPFAQKVFDKLKVHPAFKDVYFGSNPGKPEFQMVVDPERAQKYGVSANVVGLELRTQVEGSTPAVLRTNGLEYNIRVRAQADQRNLKTRVPYLTVPNINFKPVALRLIANPVEKMGPTQITRWNRSRSISIAADIAPDGPGLGGALQDIKQMFATDFQPPAGITYAFVGQAENFQELLINMIIAMGLGILFIYLVLSSLYESFVTPFTIMLVLPLALCGAFIALFITHKSLDLFSMIGCVMLLGVATKNSILLVDYTKQMMALGKSQRDSVLEAGRTRLRPILMTSFALIAGMLPIAIGLNEASKQRTSMGIAIIGGLISSTVLTLFIVPAAFSYIEKLSQWVSSFFRSDKKE